MIDITTMNNTRVQNNQIVGPSSTIGSNINIDANNVWGSVGIQNQVLCNGASVSTDPVLTAVSRTRNAMRSDPYSSINDQHLQHGRQCGDPGFGAGQQLRGRLQRPEHADLSRR